MSTLKSNIQLAPQEIFVSSTTQGTDLGALATTGDGRYFRYVKAGAVNLVPGTLVQGSAWDVTNFAPAGGLAVGQAVATGGVSFTISTSTTIAANALQGAIMSVAVTPGQGYAYKVKSNSATSAATGCVITLEDPLQTNLSTASRVVFNKNLYDGVIITPTTPTSVPVGVAVSALASGSYGWIQTKGLASCLIGTTAGLGQSLSINSALVTGGSLAPATGAVWPILAIAVSTANINEYDLVNLCID